MFVESIISEQWVLNGQPHGERPDAEDVLYIKPLLQSRGKAAAGTLVLHSLILDNNVFNDFVENRRPENNTFIADLLRSTPIELNPTFAMIEQRQTYAGAPEKLKEYAELLERTFGWSAAKVGSAEFETSLAESRVAIKTNIELLSGYLAATVFLYHQTAPASEKLKWLAGIVENSDLPFFQLHFYFAALVFLATESPSLFHPKDLKKIKSDMKVASSYEEQKAKLSNLSNDLALPTLAIFPAANLGNALVFPYVATRDRLVQLFLSEISCQMIVDAGNGRANGSWVLKSTGIIKTNLGDAVEAHIPRRYVASSKDDVAVRKIRLGAFTEQYTKLCVESKIHSKAV